MNAMTELEREIEAACTSLGMNTENLPDRDAILQRIQEKFVAGNPRAWWTGFKRSAQVFHFENDTAHLHLHEIAPATSGEVWFIADEDNECLHLYSLPLERIKDVIGECRYCEYYVAAKDLSWLMAENDHGALFLISGG